MDKHASFFTTLEQRLQGKGYRPVGEPATTAKPIPGGYSDNLTQILQELGCDAAPTKTFGTLTIFGKKREALAQDRLQVYFASNQIGGGHVLNHIYAAAYVIRPNGEGPDESPQTFEHIEIKPAPNAPNLTLAGDCRLHYRVTGTENEDAQHYALAIIHRLIGEAGGGK